MLSGAELPPQFMETYRKERAGQRFASRMGVPCLIPEIGPFPPCDSMGMMSAAAVLDRSLDRGRTKHFVHWATFRGTRSFITNATQAGVSGLSDSVGGYKKSKMWISGVVTHSFWFTRFMEGLHKQVGEVRHQDKPITIEVLHELDRILEAEWQQAKLPSQKRQVAEMGTWFIVGFCSGLRGEEMLLVELAGTARDLVFLADVVCPHFILVVSGRTKGNQLSGAKLGVPIAARTEGTNLLPGKWIQQLVKIMTVKNDTRGRLFRRNLSPTRLFEFEFDFFRLLLEVQSTTSLIDKSKDVDSEYRILCSCRQGMTAHARNMRVSKDDLKTFNRWSQEMKAQTGLARLDMPETYSSLEAIKPLLLRVTRSF
jgi:hypothetical protein